MYKSLLVANRMVRFIPWSGKTKGALTPFYVSHNLSNVSDYYVVSSCLPLGFQSLVQFAWLCLPLTIIHVILATFFPRYTTGMFIMSVNTTYDVRSYVHNTGNW